MRKKKQLVPDSPRQGQQNLDFLGQAAQAIGANPSALLPVGAANDSEQGEMNRDVHGFYEVTIDELFDELQLYLAKIEKHHCYEHFELALHVFDELVFEMSELESQKSERYQTLQYRFLCTLPMWFLKWLQVHEEAINTDSSYLH